MRSRAVFLVGLILVVAGLFGGVSAGSVVAATSTTVTWKISTLTAGQVKSLSAIATSNSPGAKTWSKTGSCVLSPTSKPTKLTMGSTGSCVLKLKIAKSGNYLAKTSSKTITRTSATTTTVAPTRWVPTCKPLTVFYLTAGPRKIHVRIQFSTDPFDTRWPENLFDNGSGQTALTHFKYSWESENSGYLPGVGTTYSGLISNGSGYATSWEAAPYSIIGHGFEVVLSGAPTPISHEERTFNVRVNFEDGGSCSTSYTVVVY